MACNNQISVGYSINARPSVVVSPIGVVSAGTLNGKDYYVWTDPWSGEDMQMFWVENSWVITLVSSPTLYLCFLTQENPCPGYIGQNNWEITGSGETFGFSAFASILSAGPIPPDPLCIAWENGTLETLPSPWNNYTFILLDFPNPETLYPGQPISELNFNNPPVSTGTGEYKIGALVYLLGTTVYNSYVLGSTFIGVLIIDSAGTIIVPSTEILNTGYVCFAETEDTSIEDNFNTCVLDKQCEFAQCVLKYLQMLQFGTINTGACKELETLKNKKRVLEILNCYDSRDIENNTTEYNNISYDEIKKLLNH